MSRTGQVACSSICQIYLIDVKDLDEAIGIAARHPGARLGTVEIRPVVELPGLPIG